MIQKLNLWFPTKCLVSGRKIYLWWIECHPRRMSLWGNWDLKRIRYRTKTLPSSIYLFHFCKKSYADKNPVEKRPNTTDVPFSVSGLIFQIDNCFLLAQKKSVESFIIFCIFMTFPETCSFTACMRCLLMTISY